MDYELRIDYADETFSVETVPADSPSDAARIALRDPEAVNATVLCSIDREPIGVLVSMDRLGCGCRPNDPMCAVWNVTGRCVSWPSR